MDTEFELESQKSKDKELTRLFCNKLSVSDFSTPFFFPTCHALKTWFKLSREQLYTNYLKGKQKLLRVIWRFKLSRARVTEGKITVNL